MPSDGSDAPSTQVRRLVVMRHAKAAWPDGVIDHDRPLAPRGRREAPRVGTWLAEEGWAPELVLCSDARRTRETVELVVQGLADAGAPAPSVRALPELYEAAVHQVLHVVAETPAEVRTVLLVGHEPTMSAAVAAITGQSLKFVTACAAKVQVDGPWTELRADAGHLCGVRSPR